MRTNYSNNPIGRNPAVHSEWLAAEQNRIEVMELWPDGPRKQAGLAAARSALHSLMQTAANGSRKLIRNRAV